MLRTNQYLLYYSTKVEEQMNSQFYISQRQLYNPSMLDFFSNFNQNLEIEIALDVTLSLFFFYKCPDYFCLTSVLSTQLI